MLAEAQESTASARKTFREKRGFHDFLATHLGQIFTQARIYLSNLSKFFG